ncbi:hypothetical protein Ahy_A06g029807 isoform C [Arachis hypogaea]|nr:hypothetical protein Ahy_A06g029807 isoform C [Arachis hypogaea]
MGSESPTNPNSISEGNRTVYPMSPPEERQMVVLYFSQRNCYGWCRCPQPSIRHGKSWMGSGCGYPDTVMGNNFVYAVANG